MEDKHIITIWIVLFFTIFCLMQTAHSSEGEGIYKANCISCHNSDPSKDGPVAPRLTSIACEVVYLKVVEGRYPDHYIPQRRTCSMPIMPHLKAYIPQICLFLQEKAQ